jgi:peptidyl-prolyl cis-trans isomerase A (cyclophilin A)
MPADLRRDMMIRALFALLAATLALPAFAQTTPATPAPAPLPRVALETQAGRIVIEVDPAKAPVTAGNFLKYVDQKKLDGITFYRVVKVADRFGFVQFGTNGDPKRILPPIRHEPTSQTGIKHLDLTISTARLAPGTARGDFTIMLGDQPSFDAGSGSPADNLGYAAFGRVVEGTEALLKIFDAPVSPTAAVRGAFKGQVPVTQVKILTARRLPKS